MYTIVSEQVINHFNVRKATWEGFNMDLLLAPNAPTDAEYLPAKVEKNGVEWWSFKGDHPGYRGLATLAAWDDELLIMLSTRFELDMVLPIRDLPKMQKIGGEFVGGRKLKELVLLKQAVAEEFSLRPIWSKRESDMLEALEKVEQEKNAEAHKAAEAQRAAVRAEEEARRERARAEREERRVRILGRKKVVGYTRSGDRRIGIPVVGGEWMCLRDGAFCISVTSYDEETGAFGDLVESFAVLKKGGGNPSKRSVATVTMENPKSITAKGTSALKELKTVVVMVKGEPEEVIMVDSVEQVRSLRDQGLNSGTLTMCPKEGEPNRFSIYRLIDGKIESAGEVKRTSA